MTRSRTDIGEPGALRIHQAIARQLGIEILSGVRRPGDRVEGEIGRADRLGVSRTAYREAMRILTAKGLLESRPKAGTHVTDRTRWNLLDPDVLAWAFSGEPDGKLISDLFELRGVIEPSAAALAARRRTDADVQLMRKALDDMRRLGLAVEGGQSADQDFHRAILQAARNDALGALASSICAAVAWTTRFKQRNHPLPRDPLPEHEAVHRAIAEGDARGARDAMSHLLDLALEAIDLPSIRLP